MIINKPGTEFEYEGVNYQIGKPIVATSESEYEGLYGIITEIRDGADKETENETPDIYCAFDLPVLPCEIKKLEATFSDLYGQPKTLGDIALDFVIMAPSMVMPLDDLREDRHYQKMYVLSTHWAVDGEQGNSSAVYADFDDAKRMMVQELVEEHDTGVIPFWVTKGEFVEDSTPVSYECYIDGEYSENHYKIVIEAQSVCVSNRFIRELAEIHQSACQLEDFVSQVSDWEELEKLTDEQYQRLIKDPRFPEMLQKALGRNDCYWESYWETVSEVARLLVNEYLQQNAPTKQE